MDNDSKAVKEVKNLLRIHRAENNERSKILDSANETVVLRDEVRTQITHYYNNTLTTITRLETLLKEIS